MVYADSCKDGSTIRRYGTTQFLLTSTVCFYSKPFFKWCGTLVLYAFFVRVRYVGTLFEFKIPGILHVALAFCMQRQKAAKADAKCVN